MKKTLLFASALLLAVLPFKGNTQALFGLTANNQLVIAGSISEAATAAGPFSIANLPAGTQLMTLAYRPSDGLLHTVGYNRNTNVAQLYSIDASYNAVPVGAAFNLPLDNDEGMSLRFESTASTLAYITTGTGDSYSINTSTGAVSENGNVQGFFGGSRLSSTAFSNGDMLGMDGRTHTILKTNKNGQPTEIDLNGLTFQPATKVSMDVFYEPTNNVAYTYFTADNGNGAALYYADLRTGNITNLGVLGSSNVRIRDIAIQRYPGRTTGNAIYDNTNTALVAFPNPVQSNTSILLADAANQPVTVYVINMNGETLKTYTYAAGGNRLDMDLSNIPQGYYSLQIAENGKNLQSLRIMKAE